MVLRSCGSRLYGCAAFAVIAILLSCTGKQTDSQEDDKQLALTDSLLKVVSVETVENRAMDDELTLNGRVEFDQTKVARVFPMLGGTVTSVGVQLGDHVERGQVIATIKSSDVADMEKSRTDADNQLRVAERNLQSVKQMFDDGMASERDLIDARRDVNSARAEKRRVAETAGIYHVAGGALYQVKAPVAGYIVERNINPQMQIRADQEDAAFVISGLKQVWVMADVYEADIAKVHEGQEVSITCLAYKDKTFHGRIDKVMNMLDEESKTMSVRISLDNTNGRLKPGMFANVVVKTDIESHQASLPCISDGAVVFENGHNYVIVIGKDKSLSRREVAIAKRQYGRCYISDGISAGEKVVSRNALLVYNALGSF